MTTTKSRKANKPELHYIARAQFKATGAILYGVQGGENTYHVTIIKGRVTGCCNATTGEDCKGFHFAGHCKHSDYAAQLEAARTEQVHEAAQVAPAILGEQFAADLPAHVEDSIHSGEFVDEPQVPGSCDLCGRWSKRAVCPWCLGVAA